MDTIDSYLTLHEAAGLLGVSETRLRQWLAEGRLRDVRKGNLRLIRRREAERFARLPRLPAGRPAQLDKR